jgi:NADPH-dependent 2,4-dienoyl-CoA reductase/sulfur reductase-like enzyme
MRAGIGIVVGTGLAGVSAARTMRQAGFGGRLLMIGGEPHLPYERPPLSKQAITASEPAGPVLLHTAASLSGDGIEVRPDTWVEEIDVRTGRLRDSRGGSLPFDRLILATGSRARRPDVPGGARILTLRGFEDALRIRDAFRPGRRVVCIGAGVIGLELASAAIARRCAVTVVERASTVMSRSLDPALAVDVAELHRAAGVVFRFGSTVEAVEEHAVLLGDGTSVPADVVVAGVGIARNTELAAAAGLRVAEGVLSDEFGRTDQPGIYAAGEVAEYRAPRLGGAYVTSEAWRHAERHGSVVGRNAAGLSEAYDDVPWFWSDQQGVNIQIAGSAGPAALSCARRSPGGELCVFQLDEGRRVVGAFALDSGRGIAAASRLIRSGTVVDPARLADPAADLRKLVAGA